MAAKHAVLGLVIEQPGYGYQLVQRLEDRCGAWRWDKSGVYSALDQLERDEQVRSVRTMAGATSGRAAPRAIYEATPRGVEFFRDWMFGSSPPTPVRHDLDLKMLLAGPEFLPRLIDHTVAQEQICIDELSALTRDAQANAPGSAASWRQAAAVLQRDAEIKLQQLRIQWLQDARGVMREFLARSAGDRRVR